MGIGQRVRELRLKSQKTPEQLAETIGISVPHYWDLEEHDDELYMTLSMGECRKLCDALGTTMRTLFEGEREYTFEELRSLLMAHLASSGRKLAEFENEVGWELGEFLNDAEKAREWNVDCLRDVCRGLCIEWRQVLAWKD